MEQKNADLLIAEFLSQWGSPDAVVNEVMEQDLRALISALGWRATPPTPDGPAIDPSRKPRRAYRL
jgi:hypothetical protein